MEIIFTDPCGLEVRGIIKTSDDLAALGWGIHLFKRGFGGTFPDLTVDRGERDNAG
jgi:hypothetical protein